MFFALLAAAEIGAIIGIIAAHVDMAIMAARQEKTPDAP